MALIGVIDVLKMLKIENYNFLLCLLSMLFEDMMHAKVGIENNFILLILNH